MSNAAADVIAGDPQRIASAGRTFASIADDVARQAAILRSLASSNSAWTGTAATRAHARAITLPPKLDKVTASYSAAGTALTRFAVVLADAQSRSRAAAAAYSRSEVDLQTARQAQAAAAESDARAAAAATAAGQPAPPPTSPRYQQDIDNAVALCARAAAANAHAHDDRDRAAALAAAALKDASHLGIHNKPWWQHLTTAISHWAKTQWHQALAQLADFAGRVSLLAGIAAAALAIGGLFFPPLEAAAAAAEGVAALTGAISVASSATNELLTPGQRKAGLLTLRLATISVGSQKILKRVPIRPHAGVVNAVEHTETRAIPLGFRDNEDYEVFKRRLNAGLGKSRTPRTTPIMQGSSVTGYSYETGAPFDEGRVSDFDVALAGREIFHAARRAGAKKRGGGIRTEPLRQRAVARLGLRSLQRQLSEHAGREVKFMVYRDRDEAVRDKPSIVMTP